MSKKFYHRILNEWTQEGIFESYIRTLRPVGLFSWMRFSRNVHDYLLSLMIASIVLLDNHITFEIVQYL